MSKKEKPDTDVDLVIKTTQGTWETTFPKTTKVEEVIKAIVKHFGFAENGNYQLCLESDPDNPLRPERPLVSYGIEDRAVLIFTDLGVAV